MDQVNSENLVQKGTKKDIKSGLYLSYAYNVYTYRKHWEQLYLDTLLIP